jgi:hypothetical protein
VLQGYNGNGPYLNGSYVVEASQRNMILANFNYRVSLFGFLASEHIRRNGDLNAGLLDQRSMMQWVQKHITQVRTRHTPRALFFVQSDIIRRIIVADFDMV